MSHTISVRRHHTSARLRRAIVALGASLALFAAPRFAQAQPTIVGFLTNFDVPNDVKDSQGSPRETEGFEIQIEGIQTADVSYAFGEAGPLTGPPALCYIRYCRPQIIQYSTGVYVRWTVAGWDSSTHQFTSNFNIPGMALTSGGTPPIASGVFFAGHQCWSLGLGAKYPQGGCEHFGVSLSRGPGATTYRWIVGDPNTGTLTYADGTPLPSAQSLPPSASVQSVPVLAPVAQVPAGGANAGQVQAIIQAPAPAPQPPAALPHRYGIAQWVKVYKKEVPREADLDELVGGHPNEQVPGVLGADRDPNAAAETEWKLLQLDIKNPDKGSSQLVSHGSTGSNSHSVVRRYEFYKYAGPIVPPGGTSGGGKNGGQVLSTDDQEASQCPRDPITNECTEPGPGELGDFIGAQNAAQNLNLNDGRAHQTIAFAPLVDRTFSNAALTLNATASSNLPVTFGTVGACSVIGSTLSIDGAGGCVVTASQAGDDAFAPAEDVLRSFIITKGAQTITFALPQGPFTFGDAPFQVSATSSAALPVAFAGSGACSVEGSTVTLTGAGMCQVTASQAGDGNFDAAADVVGSTNVAKAAATVAFDPATLSQVYSGAVKTVAATTQPAGLTLDLSFTGTPRNAGTYPVTATINDVNYAGSASATLAIEKASATIVVTPYAVSYDGLPHTATGAATGVKSEVLAGLDLSGTTHTNAGSYAADAWTFIDATGNYNNAGAAVGDSIGKVNATVAVGGYSGIYDGAAHGASGTAKGVNNEDLHQLLHLGATFTNAPGGSAAWSFDGDVNYNAAAGTVAITIGQASSTVTVVCPASVASTGSPLTPCTAAATGAAMAAVNVTASLIYANNISGPTATATATWAGDVNHTGSTGSGSFLITFSPPPVVNPIAPIDDQRNTEGDLVELRVQVSPLATGGAQGRQHDDDEDDAGAGMRGVFAATNLPPGLEIQPRRGVIHGRLGKNAAGDWHVTVAFTRGGQTFTRTFTWHVADGRHDNRIDEREQNERGER